MTRTPLPAIALLLAAGLSAACSSGSNDLALGVRHSAAAGGDLWVLNEAFGRVVRIDADSGGVATVRVGADPVGLAATADGGWVMTLSPSTRTLWAVRGNAAGMEAEPVPVRAHHNALEVSPSPAGRYAVTFVDLAAMLHVDIEGTASFNEVVVVDLNGTTPLATPVVVGFNPRQVVFTPDGTKAVVLSESYASILDLASPADPVRVPLGANTTGNPVTPETAIVSADGSAALVARRGSRDVFLIALDPPSVNIVDVGLAPTRFVSSADGATVVAIQEGAAGVALIDPAGATSRLVSTAGPVTDAAAPHDADDRRVIAWGSGTLREEVYEVDLIAATARTLRLVNPPTRVAFGPDGTSVILHVPHLTPGGDAVQQLFDVHESLSVVDAQGTLVTPVLLDARPADVAFGTDPLGAPIAWATLQGSGRVARVDLGTQLSDHVPVAAVPRDLVPLAADPLAVAPVAVVHDQPFGLVTFLPPAGGAPRVVSGFLLEGSLE